MFLKFKFVLEVKTSNIKVNTFNKVDYKNYVYIILNMP